MIQKTVFVTVDGQEFDTEAAAQAHENVVGKIAEIEEFANSLHSGKQARTIVTNAIKGWIQREQS